MDIHRAGRLPETIGALPTVDLDRVSTLGVDTLVLVAALLLMAGAWRAQLPLIRGLMGEWRVRWLLRRQGVEAAHDLLLPRPDKAGWTQLDHLVRLPDRLLVLETKCLRGRLSGRVDERTWTQQFGPWRFGFLNPLWQNALHLEAVRACAGPGVRVEGMVVLLGRGWFADRLPEGCYRLEGLRRRLVEPRVPAGSGERWRVRLDGAWSAIHAAASHRWRDRRRHLADIEAAHGGKGWLTSRAARAVACGLVAGILLGLYIAP